MAKLEAAMRRTRLNRSVLVLDADADRLQAILETLAAPRAVILVDFRVSLPSSVMAELERKLSEDQIVHIAIGSRLDLRLLNALWDLHHNQTIQGVVVLSTSASRWWELSGAFTDAAQRQDLFPSVVDGGDHTAKWIPPKFRQAVILIHGMGEQRPGRTLRTFADAVLPTADGEEMKYRTTPDDVSFDYRKLVANVTIETQGHRGLPAVIKTPRSTDFFEYYWAAKVEETTWRHVVRWLLRLLRNKPETPLYQVWVVSWLLLATGLLGGLLGVGASLTDLFSPLPAFALSITSWIGLAVLETIVLGYLGDAARYFDDHPSNEKIRTEVLQGGVELLKTLIRSRAYDRIVVVGHSLGSVIAYDVLRYLWETEFWKAYENGAARLWQTALEEYVAAACGLSDEADEKDVVNYQQKQTELLREIRILGNTWPVTDLVTLASPLAHAPYLISNFNRRRADGEFQQNPPQAFERKVGSTSVGKRFASKANFIENQPRVLLSNGLFGVTRWTNLYFPTRWGLFGDFVSGPVRPWFGSGVRDREVSAGSILRDRTLAAHVSYWHPSALLGTTTKTVAALDALIDALDLNGERLGIERFEKS